MKEDQVGRLLAALWKDLQEPSVLWQAGVLAVCVLLAWLLSRRAQWRAPDESSAALKLGAGSLRRVTFSFAAMVLLMIARWLFEHWQPANLLTVAIPLFATFAGVRFAVYLLRLSMPPGSWLDAFERGVVVLIWAMLALHLTGLLPGIVEFLDDVKVPLGKSDASFWTLLRGAFWVALTLLFALWAGSALETKLMGTQGLNSSLRVVLARFGKGALVVAAILVVLPLVGIDLTLLSVFGGALGVGVGLGLQKIVSNYLSGFIILLDRSIRLGDTITVDGNVGEVKRITTRYTMVRSAAGIQLIVPNDTLVTTTVLNHSYNDGRVRVALKLQVAYDTDVDEVLRMLASLAAAHPQVLDVPAPQAQVLQFTDIGVEIELGFWISGPNNAIGSVRSAVSARVLAEFRARGIQVPTRPREAQAAAPKAKG